MCLILPVKTRVDFYPLGLDEVASCSWFVAMCVTSYQNRKLPFTSTHQLNRIS